MTNQPQGPGSSSPADLPTKRKRGRPRKDENLAQAENSSIPTVAASDMAKKIRPQCMGTNNAPSNDMVGQVVSGVIDGSFDAGYFLNVKVADSDTFLRGLVFLPGQYTPVTAANDVAPNVKMYQRKEIPVPFSNPSSQHQSASLSSEKSDGKPAEVKNESPKFLGQVQKTELFSGISDSVCSENQSAAVNIPPGEKDSIVKHDLIPERFGSDLSLGEKALEQKTADSLLVKDKVFGEDQATGGFGTGLSLGEKVLEQKSVESVLEKDKFYGEDQAPEGFGSDLSLGEKILEQKTVESVMEKDMVFGEDQAQEGFGSDLSLGEKILEQKNVESPLEKDKTVEGDQEPEGFGNSITLEEKIAEPVLEKDGAAEQDQVPPVFGTGLSLGENVSEQKFEDSELKDEALAQDQVMQEFDAGLSGQETLECSLEKGVIDEQNQIAPEFGTFKLEKEPEIPEELALPSVPYNQILQPNEASNQLQVEHQTPNSDLKPDVMVKASVFELNQFPAFPEPATGLDMLMEKYASPRQDDLHGSETGTYSAPMTSIELNLFGAEHIPSETKPAANDSDRMVGPQPFSSPIDVNTSSMECNVNDTIPTAQS